MNTRNVPSIDISYSPELVRLVEEVNKTKKPRILKKNSEQVALLMPVGIVTAPRKQPKADDEAFYAAAGSWKDVDIEQFKKDIYTSRTLSTRPPVEL